MIDDKPVPDDNDPEDDGTAPTEQATADSANQTTLRKQRRKALSDWEKEREFWSRSLRDEAGGQIIWNLLRELRVFEDEAFACGPNGFPSPEATLHARGQRDFGLRLYRKLVWLDREAVFALHDRYDHLFKRPNTARKSSSER